VEPENDEKSLGRTIARIFHTPHEMPTGRSAGFSLQAASRVLLQAKACAPPRVCEISRLGTRQRGDEVFHSWVQALHVASASARC